MNSSGLTIINFKDGLMININNNYRFQAVPKYERYNCKKV